MALKLDNILPGKRVRTRKIQGDTGIDHITIMAMKGAVMCVAWRRFEAQQLFSHCD